jgi:superoxide dismutase, Fe-Mn family
MRGQSTRGESDDHDHRKFLKAVSAAAASTAVLAGTQVLAQGNLRAAAKAMPYQAKPMPFDPKAITGISEKVAR